MNVIFQFLGYDSLRSQKVFLENIVGKLILLLQQLDLKAGEKPLILNQNFKIHQYDECSIAPIVNIQIDKSVCIDKKDVVNLIHKSASIRPLETLDGNANLILLCASDSIDLNLKQYLDDYYNLYNGTFRDIDHKKNRVILCNAFNQALDLAIKCAYKHDRQTAINYIKSLSEVRYDDDFTALINKFLYES